MAFDTAAAGGAACPAVAALELVETLAELTLQRDREVLDVSLARTLKDLLRPLSVSVHRPVGEAGDERWRLRARLGATDIAAISDPAWLDRDALPHLAELPQHARALRGGEIVAEPLTRGCAALTVFPLTTEAGTTGVVAIETTAPLDATALRLVCSILRLHGNFEGLLDDSERDTLTGLRNRKTFDREFLKLTTEAAPARVGPGGAATIAGAEANRAGAVDDSWLGVIDIDHFKRVNDGHGHLIGDEVLLLLSRLMRGSFRFGDHLFRFGGEEFVVLMRCAGEAQALAALERLRSRVEAFSFPRAGQVTISIGLSAVHPGELPNASFQRADQAVYWAKGHGRNQVCSFSDLVARGELQDARVSGNVELF